METNYLRQIIGKLNEENRQLKQRIVKAENYLSSIERQSKRPLSQNACKEIKEILND